MNGQLTMNKMTFYGSIALAAVLALSIGTAIGGGFAMRQADAAIDAIMPGTTKSSPAANGISTASWN